MRVLVIKDEEGILRPGAGIWVAANEKFVGALKKDGNRISVTWFANGKWWHYEGETECSFDGNTEANARAEMLIYLLENEVIFSS